MMATHGVTEYRDNFATLAKLIDVLVSLGWWVCVNWFELVGPIAESAADFQPAPQ